MSRLDHVLFPGSFDPLTSGHVDLVRRALTFCDTVTLGVLDNSSKKPLFTAGERVAIIQEVFAEMGDRVRAEAFHGLLVDFARRIHVSVIIRGLRATSDYDYEAQMALMNRSLGGNIETLFMSTREQFSYVSSSVVKQVAFLGGDISHLVPPAVSRALQRKKQP